MPTSFNVKIWDLRENPSKRKDAKGRPIASTWVVRWTVAGREAPSKTFKTKQLADGFRSKLLKAAREGEAFDTVKFLPVSMVREETPASEAVTWFAHAMSFADMKWPDLAPKSRQTLASCLAHATLHLATTTKSRPPLPQLSVALTKWAFNSRARESSPAPDGQYAVAIQWISTHSVPVADLAELDVTRQVLRGLRLNLNGSKTTPVVYARRRAVFFGAVEYAIEKDHLGTNPIRKVKLAREKSERAVEPSSVANIAQGRLLINAAKEHKGKYGGRMAAFFGLMFWAGLRPAECVGLRVADLTLPPDGWGSVVLRRSDPTASEVWRDEGEESSRSLKHRGELDTRDVPLDPEVVALLRWHLEMWPADPVTGRVFSQPRDDGESVGTRYLTVFHSVRSSLAIPAEVVVRPYDLRHACVSRQLAQGIPAAQVAEWAGHSLEVLLKIYAKVISGQVPMLLARMDEAKRAEDDSDDQAPDEEVEQE